jgi:hypothetical protein
MKFYQGTRHRFSSQNVNNGLSLELIGAKMGHSNTATTWKIDNIKMVGNNIN